MKKIVLIAVLIAAVTVAVAGCSGINVEGVPSTVAKVNGETISASEYFEIIHRGIGRQVLQNLIEQKFVIDWAKAEGVAPTAEQIKVQEEFYIRTGEFEEREKYLGKAGLKLDFESRQARANLAEKFFPIKDEDLKQVYEMMKSRYVHGPKKQIAIIMNFDKSKIDEAAKKIADGEDFDQVALTYMQGGMGMSGAYKTWIDMDDKNSPINKQAEKLKVGEVSEVFELGEAPQVQFLLIKVINEKEKSNLKMKDVKDELKFIAAYQKSQSEPEFRQKMNERIKEANITVNIQDFKDIETIIKNPPDATPMMAPPPPPPAEEPKEEKKETKKENAE
ncbi:MAG: peptidyl-prolyl cis-trans isomerase [Armatimonadota bacterium]